jgi:hypothetical protein
MAPTREIQRGAGTIAVAAGLAVGVLTSFGQTWLSGAPAALANSASAWLVAPFAVGALFRTRGQAAVAGLVCCLLQLIAYDICSVLRGYSVSSSRDVFWAVCAVIGGPLFGLAGHAWRYERPGLRGLGPATLAAAFIAEGLWNYLHELHYDSTAWLWLGIGAAIAVLGLRGLRDYRWLAATIPLGLIGEIVLTQIQL